MPLTDVTPDPWPAAILAQPDSGKRLQLAHGVTSDNHLLLGFGNYGPNTGPVDAIGYRPSDGHVATYISEVNTEELWVFRALDGGTLWAPALDPGYPPRMPDDVGNAAKITSAGVGSKVAVQAAGVSVAVHIFDVANDGLGGLYVCGARDVMPGEGPNLDGETAAVAFVWRSTDGGATWAEAMGQISNSPANGGGGGFHRCYGFGKIGNTLYVAPTGTGQVDGNDPDEVPVNAYWYGNGTTWTRVVSSNLAQLYYPPVWGETTFGVRGGGGRWAKGEGTDELVAANLPGFYVPLLADGDEYLFVTGGLRLMRGDTLLGLLPGSTYSWHAARDHDGIEYLSDGSHIYRLDA